jgi:hypothetical protein
MIIEDEDDLLEFADIVVDGGNYQDAILSADLSFNDWTSIAPIVLGSGVEPPAYRGTFDGNGHTIELKKTGSIAHTALFYSTGREGVIKDLVVSVDFDGTSGRAAGVVVKHGGRIERVKVYGRIVTNASQVAGFVAETYNLSATLSECVNYASITAGNKAGGFAAYFSGIMEYCANYGDITSTTDAPGIGGLWGVPAVRGGNTISNSYNVGTISAPNKRADSNSNNIGGLWGFVGLYGQFMEGDDLYFRSYATNIFSYGDVLLNGGKGAVIDGGKFSGAAFDNVVNFFYRKEAGSRAFWAGGVEGDDGWGSDYVKTKITEISEEDFRNGTLLSILNAHPTGKYPDGSPRWVQGENFPELAIFRPDLATTDPGMGGGDTDPDLPFSGSGGGCDAGLGMFPLAGVIGIGAFLLRKREK